METCIAIKDASGPFGLQSRYDLAANPTIDMIGGISQSVTFPDDVFKPQALCGGTYEQSLALYASNAPDTVNVSWETASNKVEFSS